MAAGDVYTQTASIANGSRLTIQPGAGVEAVVHNIMYGGAVELHRLGSAQDLTFDSDTAAGNRTGFYHVTNAHYLEVKNVSGGPIVIAYDGMVTK